jgi:hypothetical protein
MRFIKWALGFIATSAIILWLAWLALVTFEPLTYYLLQLLYGEGNMNILAIKVMGIGVFVALVSLLLLRTLRAIFSHSR